MSEMGGEKEHSVAWRGAVAILWAPAMYVK